MRVANKLTAVVFVLLPTAVLAQETTPTDTAIPALMFFTIGAALAVGIGGLMFFLRKRSNRAAADRALNPTNPANRL